MTDLWMAWSDEGRSLAALFGSTRSRLEMERIIAAQKRGKGQDALRPVRVTVHLREEP